MAGATGAKAPPNLCEALETRANDAAKALIAVITEQITKTNDFLDVYEQLRKWSFAVGEPIADLVQQAYPHFKHTPWPTPPPI